MKKLLLIIIFVFISCDKKDEIIDRLITVKNIPVSKQVNVPVLPYFSQYPDVFQDFPIPVEVDVKKEIREKTKVSDVLKYVKNVQLTSLEFELNSALNAEDFNFLNSMTLYVKVEGKELKKIGWIDAVSSDLKTITFETTDDFIDEYMQAEKMILFIQYKSNKTVKEYKSTMKMKFKVNVKRF